MGEVRGCGRASSVRGGELLQSLEQWFPTRGGGGHFAPRGHLAMSEDISIFNWVGGAGGR